LQEAKKEYIIAILFAPSWEPANKKFPHQTRQAAEALVHIRSLAKKEIPLMGEKTKHDDPC
jgi:hypothetical protein